LSTLRRIFELPTQVLEEVQPLPVSSMVPLVHSFLTGYELILLEISHNPSDRELSADEINARFDTFMMDFQQTVDRFRIRNDRPESRPSELTTYFHGAHHIIVNGGNFGYFIDWVVRDQCRWILRALIFQTSVLFR